MKMMLLAGAGFGAAVALAAYGYYLNLTGQPIPGMSFLRGEDFAITHKLDTFAGDQIVGKSTFHNAHGSSVQAYLTCKAKEAESKPETLADAFLSVAAKMSSFETCPRGHTCRVNMHLTFFDSTGKPHALEPVVVSNASGQEKAGTKYSEKVMPANSVSDEVVPFMPAGAKYYANALDIALPSDEAAPTERFYRFREEGDADPIDVHLNYAWSGFREILKACST